MTVNFHHITISTTSSLGDADSCLACFKKKKSTIALNSYSKITKEEKLLASYDSILASII